MLFTRRQEGVRPTSFDEESQEAFSYKRQSLMRQWYRLSRLQKTIVYLLVLLALFAAVYAARAHGRSAVAVEDMLRRHKNVKIIEDYEQLEDEERLRNLNKSAGVADVGDIGEPVLVPPARHPLPNAGGVAVGDAGPQPRATAAAAAGAAATHGNDGQVQVVPAAVVERKPMTFAGPATQRQVAVVDAFRHTWKAYKQYAWGHDQLKPLTRSHDEWFNLGLTIVDSLDTIYIMGLSTEFKEARDWVATSLTLDVARDVNLFEVTIRILGGLLSAYHLSADRVFVDKAIDLGNRLLPAFKTESGVPYSDVNLRTGYAHGPQWNSDSSTSEVTTIQLEFKDLSRVSGDPKYEQATDRVRNHVHGLRKKEGLVPMFINPEKGELRDTATITLGARADSYYEYLLKQWLQTGRTVDSLKSDYLAAVLGIKNHLARESHPSKLLFIGELLNGRTFSPKMDHLACYFAGTLALGTRVGFMPPDHMALGERLLHTCHQMYARMATYLSPEIAHFCTTSDCLEDIYVKPADGHNLLRPETVESLFYFYRFTKDEKYRDWGWNIFQGFMNYTRVADGGFCAINNVQNTANPSCRDTMDSFWTAETLKYFYLLFADEDLIPLDKFVFNTEAHPLPVYDH